MAQATREQSDTPQRKPEQGSERTERGDSNRTQVADAAADRMRHDGGITPESLQNRTFHQPESKTAQLQLPGFTMDQNGFHFTGFQQQDKLSRPVEKNDGYAQTIHKMYPNMSGSDVSRYATEARHLNNDRTSLTRGERFQMPEIHESQQGGDAWPGRGGEHYQTRHGGDRTPGGRDSHKAKQDPESAARDQRAQQTHNDFYAKDPQLNDGLDAGRRNVPDMRSTMGLNEKDNAAVDKWLADPKNSGKNLGDAVTSLKMRTPEQVQKAFGDHSTMIKDHDAAKNEIVASLGAPSEHDARLQRAQDSNLGTADQPGRQQAARDQFSKEPWNNVPKEQLTGLPNDKQAQIAEARAQGDKRPIEQIGKSMGFFDDKRAGELSKEYSKLDFVHDRAVKEDWKGKEAFGTDVGKEVKHAEAVYDHLPPDQARQVTRPESGVVGLHGKGGVTDQDRATLGSTFRAVDRSVGPDKVSASEMDTPEKFNSAAQKMLNDRAKVTGESTSPEALKAEKDRILALNPGSGETPAAGANGKINMYSGEQLHNWREQAGQNRVGNVGEFVKSNSGGKVSEDMVRRATDLSAAYQAVDGPNSTGHDVGTLLKQQGADGNLVDSANAWQGQAKDSVHNVADKYNAAHPDRYTLPEVEGKDIKGSWNTVYQPVSGEGGRYGFYQGIDLREHTLQAFLKDPVKAGYVATAVDKGHTPLGSMFSVPEYNAMYKEQLAQLKEKFGDAYEKKYGRPLDQIYCGAIDTGGAVKGRARVDFCVDPGTAGSMAHLNSPDGHKTFTMRQLYQNGKRMTIDTREKDFDKLS
jgi:hypothetical protein